MGSVIVSKRSARALRGAFGLVFAFLLAAYPGNSGQAAGTNAAGYVLGPEDALQITVWGYPDLTVVVSVQPDGRISAPLAGTVQAGGRSIQQVVEDLTRAYAVYIINPQVTVTMKEFRKIHAAVLGQVARPGTYDLPLGTSLLDLVAAGGGPTDVAALKQVQFLRPGRAAVVVDLTKVMGGDPASNVPLAGGETLVIPEDLTSFVTVQGQVARPGRYRLKGELRVLDALALAGGLTDRASVTQASLTRASAAPTGPAASTQAGPPSSTTEHLGLDDLLLHQEMDHNIVLQPGDIVTVPEDTTSKIYIIGDVRTPGVFPLKDQVSLLQAIALAGGPEQRGFATAKTAYIVRRNSVGPQREVVAGPATVSALPKGGVLINADLGAIMQDPTKDVTVQPGDVIVMPMSGRAGLQLMMSILAGFGWLLHF